MPKGVLPIQTLREFVDEGVFIKGVSKKYLNPASIDLPLSDEAYRVETIFLPIPGEDVRDALELVGATPHRLTDQLEVGVTYVIRIEGEWRLPSEVYGYANPKSSIGRLNLFCRTIADKVAMYDSLIGPGWSGELWVLVRPDSFPVLVSPGLALSQVRLFYGTSFLGQLEGEIAAEKYGLLFQPNGLKIDYRNLERHADSFVLSIYVGRNMGWECRGTRKVLDLSKLDHYDPEQFFMPVTPQNGKATLRKDTFYILSTNERVMVPPHLSAELRAIDPRLGEFRSHAAGYIDPGWGWGKDGSEHGRPITLEVIPFENTLVRPGQKIARIRYEKMHEEPEVNYDSADSNYVHQLGAKLSKHFKAAE
jgi:dCTP deaminase